jgi:hypothetical protein
LIIKNGEDVMKVVLMHARSKTWTLDNIVKHKHSDGNADDGENFPAHLRILIELWNQIKKEAEDTRCDNLTQSQKNRVVADSVTGVTAPLGIDTNATARASTTAENKRGGSKIAERNKTLPGAFSGSSGDADSPDDAKKQKRAKTNDILSQLLKFMRHQRMECLM